MLHFKEVTLDSVYTCIHVFLFTWVLVHYPVDKYPLWEMKISQKCSNWKFESYF